MAAAVQAPDFLIRHVGDHLLGLGILAEEMLARIRAALGFEVLVLAVHALFHQALEQSLLIALEQRIPARAPHHLDDIPAGAQERRLEFLDDLAVAAHRSIEALQIAIDHEDQVVEFLAHRHGQRAHRFGLVHFAIAQGTPRPCDRRAARCRDAPDSARNAPGKSPSSGPNPIDTVGYCQKSGISQGCG
jgi:hypothetical protein